MNFKGKMRKKTGITLISLVITIIILLILAGITIATITGDNGIIKNAKDAKEQSEIAEEKETVDRASLQAMGNNKRGNLVEDELQEQLDKITDRGKTEVSYNGENFEIVFVDSNRYYTVDKNGNIIEDGKIVVDKFPGDITKDLEGNILTGNSLEEAYQINCIEDLVAFSNLSRGSGIVIKDGKIKQLTESEKEEFRNKYIIMTRDLNFKSKYSYTNSERTDFGDINGNENDGNTLINEMTTEKGFKPIGTFWGNFDGNGKKLNNLYEKNNGNMGIIENLMGTVKNLEISGEIICLGDTAGGIAAKNGIVENCINRVNIKATGNQIGGILGLGGTAKNCKNYGNIEGISQIGGIGGRYTITENCENYGNIGNEASNLDIGGIIGQTSGLINNCINKGDVIGKTRVGGIAGDPQNTRMINCMNLGQIKGTDGIGGIVGKGSNFYCIINCNNLGKVIGEKNVGGIIGCLEYITNTSTNGKIANCYNLGNLEAKNYIGGIVGLKSGYGTHYIENCYWKTALNLDYGTNSGINGGILQVTNTKAYKEEEMKQAEFLQILNQYVETYNSGNKEYTDGNELQKWELNSKIGYPIVSSLEV